MPTWRKLHTKTIDSLDVNEMPDDFHRLAWALLPLILDAEGRGLDDGSWLKSKLFPLRRDVTISQVEQVMDWWGERGMVERYEVDGRRYFQVPTFHEYQGKTDREATSVIPEPVKRGRKTNSRPTHESVTSRSSSDVDVDAEERKHAGEEPPAPAPVEKPDPVKELAAIFEQVAGIELPSSKTKSGKRQIGTLWWAPLREMVRVADGRAPDLLRASVLHLRKDGLTIANPNSALKTFISMAGQLAAAPPVPFKDY